ncbi:MAG: hypothetical protein WC029_00945 [Sulfuricella sp.]|jgi:hypothetical protein
MSAINNIFKLPSAMWTLFVFYGLFLAATAVLAALLLKFWVAPQAPVKSVS